MPEPHRPRVAILISGRGSNMEALLVAMRDGRVPAEAAVVISNVPQARGLERARGLGVATDVVDHTVVRPRAAHERAVLEILDRHGIDLVCLAGYMRLLSPVLLEAYPGAILNVHPSLLPAFPGLDAQRQALDFGVKVSGCTVHLVDGELDHGPILVQRAVPVLEDDTEETLSARILEQEHLAYPEALGLCASGRIRVEGRRVVLAR